MKLKLKVWIPLICIILIVFGVTFILMHNLQTTIDENITESEKNEELNGSEEEKIENETKESNRKENVVKDEEKGQEQVVTNTSSEKNSNKGTYTAGATDDKERAIELVKAEYDGSDEFNFVFDYINEDGEYVIAVKEKETALVKQYFRVNLENSTVEPE